VARARWLTPRNARAVWGPLAGPQASDYYVLVLKFTIWSCVSGLVLLIAGVIGARHNWLVTNLIAAGGLVGIWGFATARLICWFRFRGAARAYLRVTDEERSQFACRSPESLEKWIRVHRPDHEFGSR
jgi:hypothetical protein